MAEFGVVARAGLPQIKELLATIADPQIIAHALLIRAALSKVAPATEQAAAVIFRRLRAIESPPL